LIFGIAIILTTGFISYLLRFKNVSNASYGGGFLWAIAPMYYGITLRYCFLNDTKGPKGYTKQKRIMVLILHDRLRHDLPQGT